jgi:hypothetical protein
MRWQPLYEWKCFSHTSPREEKDNPEWEDNLEWELEDTIFCATALSKFVDCWQTTGARQVWKPGRRAAMPMDHSRAGAARRRLVLTS